MNKQKKGEPTVNPASTTGADDFFEGDDAPVSDDSELWAAAQLERTATLPNWILAAAGEHSMHPPEGCYEGPDGLYGPAEYRRSKKLSNGYLRYVGSVLEAGERRIVGRLIAIAKPPRSPHEKVQWELLRVEPGAVVKASRFEDEIVRVGDYFLDGKDDALRRWVRAHGDRPEFRLQQAWGSIDGESIRCLVYSNAIVKGGEVHAFHAASDPGFRVESNAYLLGEELLKAARLPALNVACRGHASPAALSRLGKLLWRSFSIAGLLTLGWAYAGLFRAAFIKRNMAYPLLTLVGRRGTGKSTLLRSIEHAFGTSGCEIGSGESTEAGLRRSLAAISGLPIRVEDLRPEAAAKHLSLLLAAFDGTGNTRASRQHATRTVDATARANVMIACESLPADAALVSRMVIAELFPADKAALREFDSGELWEAAECAGMFLLTNIDKEREDALIEQTAKWEVALGSLEERQRRQVWAPALAGLSAVMQLAGMKQPSQDRFMNLALAHARDMATRYGGRGWAEAFFDDIVAMVESGALSTTDNLLVVKGKKEQLWVNLAGLVPLWRKWCRHQGRPGFLEQRDVRRDLKGMPWFIGQKKVRGSTKSINAVGIDLAHAQLPEAIRQLVE